MLPFITTATTKPPEYHTEPAPTPLTTTPKHVSQVLRPGQQLRLQLVPAAQTLANPIQPGGLDLPWPFPNQTQQRFLPGLQPIGGRLQRTTHHLHPDVHLASIHLYRVHPVPEQHLHPAALLHPLHLLLPRLLPPPLQVLLPPLLSIPLHLHLPRLLPQPLPL